MKKNPDTLADYALYLESLRREQLDQERRRTEYLGQHAEMIRYNYGRGMSRQTLVAKYGEGAVTVALGTTHTESVNEHIVVAQADGGTSAGGPKKEN